MPYIIYALDHANSHELREDNREAHRIHLASVGKKLLSSGALLGKDNKTIIGGLSILDTDDLQEAQQFSREDPYNQMGIRRETQILKWRNRWDKGQFIGET